MHEFKGQTILITGGTGSFGSAFLHAIRETDFKEVRILSRDELKQFEMRNSINDRRVRFFIGDVRNRESVDDAMEGVDCVFHAAALKQVPTCEFFPMEAVLTNVVGSDNVVQSAFRNRVKRLVCLSTDKAVYPINALGMTKGLMEKVAISAARTHRESKTVVCCVRYGNVLCSRGSVIPLFAGQIKAGKPVTVTAPDMTRFMLPLQEAIGLVHYAFNNGYQGDIFVRKAPASTIADIAKALHRILGRDTGIKVIGIRHGEKLFETLATRDELGRCQDCGDYYRIAMDDRDLNYDKYYVEGAPKVPSIDDYTSHNTERLSLKRTEELIRSLPEMADLVDARPHV